MIVYHVCGATKLLRYAKRGYIKSPVRAWMKIQAAERFSKQTGRPIILRLNFPANAKFLPGHRNEACYVDHDYDVSGILGKVLA